MMIATCVPLSCGLRGRLRAYYRTKYTIRYINRVCVTETRAVRRIEVVR